MKIWPLLLLFGGCATTSMDDLIQQRTACLSEGTCTDEIHEKIERKEKYLAQREYDEKDRCPDLKYGIEYCDTRYDRGCGNRHRKDTDDYHCIDRNQYNSIFRGY